MNRTWMGTIVACLAGLALACSAQRKEQRGEGTASAGTGQDAATAQAGGTAGAPAPDSTATQDQASQGTASATPAGTTDQPAQPAAKEMAEVEGRVVAVTREELRIQPVGKDEVKLKVDATTTTVELDGRQASLTELTPGTEVRASYEEAQGDKSAVTVHGRTGKASTSGATPSGTMEPGGTMQPGTSPSGTSPSDSPPGTMTPSGTGTTGETK